MKICLAQVKPEKANINTNIENHKKWIHVAISEKVDLIVFPELSLTGYEPKLAKELAIDQNDERLEEFQIISDHNEIVIGVGIPIKSQLGILISMVFFQPNRTRQTYAKQILHSDEKPYFIEGSEQIILTVQNIKIAPAICYESLQPEHTENAKKLGAELYLASVAKSQSGIDKAFEHFPKIALKYSMPTLLCNYIGHCDNFESAGQSAIWDINGKLIGQLDESEGLLIYDTDLKTTNRAESILHNTGNRSRSTDSI